MVWVFWKMRLSVLTHTITVLLHEVKGWASTAGYELVCLSRALGGHNHTLILCCALSALQPLQLFLWIAALCTRSGPFFSYFSFFLFCCPGLRCLPFLLTFNGPPLTSSPCEPSDSGLQARCLGLPICSIYIFYRVTNTLLNCESERAGMRGPGRRRWCPEIRLLSRTTTLSQVRQLSSSVSHLWQRTAVGVLRNNVRRVRIQWTSLAGHPDCG